ncbi:molybdenum cofactor guanylyltransferase [Sandarakinorhabdus sp. DWP1-3-1]|uniref:molybdenum cofactor guanylyltransferase n=1 Tax=Sandarakinorhabdus sp. DWP1-3-1 TaxID=2804627 RepID=UPI003CF66E8B
MKILGAVLAGGRSSRFGSDKALAPFDGRPLIDHVIAALAAQADTVVVIGRDWPRQPHIHDRPAPGLGPLGGLCAALHHAAATGHDAVLAAGCDLPRLPADLGAALAPGPAHVLGQPTVGLWPSTLAAALDAHLAGGGRSLHGWAAHCNARVVDLGPLPNINTPADLRAL